MITIIATNIHLRCQSLESIISRITFVQTHEREDQFCNFFNKQFLLIKEKKLYYSLFFLHLFILNLFFL